MRRRTGRYGAQNFIVGHEVVPTDVQDASLATYMEGIQSFPIGLYRPVSHSRFSPTPADSMLSVASRLTLVKPPKNLQAIASRKARQPLAFH